MSLCLQLCPHIRMPIYGVPPPDHALPYSSDDLSPMQWFLKLLARQLQRFILDHDAARPYVHM